MPNRYWGAYLHQMRKTDGISQHSFAPRNGTNYCTALPKKLSYSYIHNYIDF